MYFVALFTLIPYMISRTSPGPLFCSKSNIWSLLPESFALYGGCDGHVCKFLIYSVAPLNKHDIDCKFSNNKQIAHAISLNSHKPIRALIHLEPPTFSWLGVAGRHVCLRIFVRVNNMRQHLLAQNNCKCMEVDRITVSVHKRARQNL